MTETDPSMFEGWAILELMGHRRLAGYVREVTLAGHGFLRLDIPGYLHTEPTGEQEERGSTTQFYPPASVYCLTPTTEEIARRLAERAKPAPVARWELPPAVEYVPDVGDDERDEEDNPF